MLVSRKESTLGLALLLLLSGCLSDSGDDANIGYTSSGEQYSPLKFRGTVSYLPGMVPESVRLVLLNNRLEPVDSIMLSVDWDESRSAYCFSTREMNFPSPYVKVVSIFPKEGSRGRMEFYQYAVVTDGNAKKNKYSVQNFFEALASDRVARLVQEEDYGLSVARETAKKDLVKIFELDEDNEYNGEYKEKLDYQKPYFYSRHFVSDSAFYDEYLNLNAVLAKDEKIPQKNLVRVADDLIRLSALDSARIVYLDSRDSSYVSNGWLWDTGYEFQMKIWNDAYNLDLAYYEYERIIDCELSIYNGRKFILDGGA